MDNNKMNETLRKTFDDIFNRKLTEKELIREKEIVKIARQEKEEYEKKRDAFYRNPLHWDNNKRRRCNLPVLRGKINKHRIKHYPAFHPSARLFCIMEDLIDEILIDEIKKSNKFFNQFVDVKDLKYDDENLFHIE